VNRFWGKDALDEVASRWALHDGRIRAFHIGTDEAGGVEVELVCVPRPLSPVRELRLRFGGVTRFDLVWTQEHAFYFVPGYTAFLTEAGRVYLSLDPFDDRAGQPDARDGGVMEAATVSAELQLKD
jgi:hypothetical protein